jgi:hypothetical protein
MYAYRVDPVSNLVKIAATGLRCGEAGRLSQFVANGLAREHLGFDPSIPVETAWAKKEGWPIPHNAEMAAARLYYWGREEMLDSGNGNMMSASSRSLDDVVERNEYVGLRFPISCLLPNRSFPDGCFRKGDAFYCIYPMATHGDSVVPSKMIEARIQDVWCTLLSVVAQLRE